MLDGVFIAVNLCTLQYSNLRFDRFYDFRPADGCNAEQLRYLFDVCSFSNQFLAPYM